jgi:hypothetical protein
VKKGKTWLWPGLSTFGESKELYDLGQTFTLTELKPQRASSLVVRFVFTPLGAKCL